MSDDEDAYAHYWRYPRSRRSALLVLATPGRDDVFTPAGLAAVQARYGPAARVTQVMGGHRCGVQDAIGAVLGMRLRFDDAMPCPASGEPCYDEDAPGWCNGRCGMWRTNG